MNLSQAGGLWKRRSADWSIKACAPIAQPKSRATLPFGLISENRVGNRPRAGRIPEATRGDKPRPGKAGRETLCQKGPFVSAMP